MVSPSSTITSISSSFSSLTSFIVVSRFSCYFALFPSTFVAMFPKTSSRIGDLRFDMVWIFEEISKW